MSLAVSLLTLLYVFGQLIGSLQDVVQLTGSLDEVGRLVGAIVFFLMVKGCWLVGTLDADDWLVL